MNRHLKIVTISGAYSGVGKTNLACRLLSLFKGWSALKVTLCTDGDCPRKRPCGICSNLNRPYWITKKDEIINQTGKDTNRLKSSGAKEVLWLCARPKGLKEGLEEAINQFDSAEGIVIEGTSVLKYLEPDLAIFIKGKKNGGLKPSAQEVLKKVDIYVSI